ncbi:MAG TPA: hypothetical protein VJK09_02750 [Candidatus Paceibacterota bacterium]
MKTESPFTEVELQECLAGSAALDKAKRELSTFLAILDGWFEKNEHLLRERFNGKCFKKDGPRIFRGRQSLGTIEIRVSAHGGVGLVLVIPEGSYFVSEHELLLTDSKAELPRELVLPVRHHLPLLTHMLLDTFPELGTELTFYREAGKQE